METANINKNGAVIYRGPSLLDGKPIFVVVTGLTRGSNNGKTGSMLQTWILRDTEEKPYFHVMGGTDFSICGDCKYSSGSRCYVDVSKAPGNVHKSYKRGGYKDYSFNAAEIAKIGSGRIVRLGSYGDPAAVPVGVWRALTAQAVRFTGYTHQWKNSFDLMPFCMASVDTLEEAEKANSLGWRTFRVTDFKVYSARKNEILCPASKEAGVKTSCERCGLCAGSTVKAKNIFIPAHGRKRNRPITVDSSERKNFEKEFKKALDSARKVA